MPEFEIDFDVCAFFIYLFSIHTFFHKKDVRGIQNFMLLGLLINGLISTVADVSASLMLRDVPRYPFVLVELANYVYFIVHYSVPASFAAYLLVVTGARKKHGKPFFVLFFLPLIAVMLLILSNSFTRCIWYYTDGTIYTYGKLRIALIAMSILYGLVDLYYLATYRKGIPQGHYLPLVGFVFSSIAAVIYQAFMPYKLVMLFTEAVVYLFILVSLENEDVLINKETEVYNRQLFIQRNRKLLNIKVPYSLLIIKFANRKYFMSVLGLNFMQEVMKEVARYLVKLVGDKRRVFDCENGTFAILVEKDNAKDIKPLTDTIYKTFMKDWVHDEIGVAFRVQLCMVDVPLEIGTLEGLLILLDSSAEGMRERVTIVRDDLLKYMQRQNAIELAVARAVARKSFEVYYQPIWDRRANKIRSAEALLRLKDPELGFIPPSEFIPVAERCGLITEIGEFVFREACDLISRHAVRDIGLNFIEVNLSAVQCMHKNLPSVFQGALEHYSIASSAINLEIAESSAINSTETFAEIMRDLHNIGFAFSLDDYGTDHAEASFLFNMDFNIIKIDRNVLWQAEQNAAARIFLRNTVRMVKEMNLKIVVEGIETEEQKNFVSSLGCDYCQGFYFSKPLPKEEFLEYCRKFNWKF